MKTIALIACLTSALVGQDTLKEKLDARSAESAKKSPVAMRAEFAKGIVAVEKSGIEKSAKQVGEKAPDFTLKNAVDEEVTLSEALKKGPVVLTWYRGGWCPYCNIALAAMQEKLPEIRAAGASLVALSPELPDKSLTTAEFNKLDFKVLSDLNHGVAKKYGIVFQIAPKVERIYKTRFNLAEYNGEEAGDKELPLSATYIIGQDGIIKWAFLKADYRQRAEPADIVEFLKKLKAEKK